MAEPLAEDITESGVSLEELKAEQEALQQKAERKRLESFWWGAVILWAGIVLIVDYLDFLPEVGESNAWSWIFLGAGILGLIGAIIRSASAELPRPTGWDYFWSALFLIIGATGFVGGGITFPIVLIVIGFAIIGNVLFRQK